ncbi:tripeptidyl-peptidase 2-like [Clytia hemisphaerica]|uniref:Tripeptidyl-peptidase 2 n=1 Tax=Clytia hemisphaerica TaxID=252671 RepID=A0A7M5TS40_9CNID
MEDFPVHGLLPKRETQIESFLRKYPEYNGDGVLIAIFDSGIDPGAPGLERTPKGERKIVDIIDCSGSGDVDTSTVVKVDAEDNTITGITGRKLTVPSSWNNPSGDFYVGCKRLYSLFPTTPRRRVKKEFKEDEWDPAQQLALSKASANLLEEETKQGSTTKTEDQKLQLDDLKSTVECLKKFNEKYDDCGPVYDCVVFHNGEEWKACVDTTQTGKLENCQLMSSFHVNGEFGRFSDKDMVNYGLTVLDDGKRLSIVTNSSSHGTHVASISSAYFEDKPELNGVAPGAKIISMQIGDNRVDGMETGTALIRALKCAVDRKVDVINLSYGESSKWANSGRVIEMMNKIVAEHNIIFMSSAGNNGPALSTVGAPGGTSEFVIGVGAYVSPDMMAAEYSMPEKLPGNQYTWSSTGPSVDGALGVCITAPGGAITSVPNWTLSKSQLMNGTSMSSPNATGGVAVLLSALNKEGIPHSPRSIRRALENTASKIDGLSNLVQGYGLLQVEKAFEFMKEWVAADKCANHIFYQIRTMEGKRGLYLREYKDHNIPEKQTVIITPKFHKNTDNNLKIEFNLNLSLVATQSWVICPAHLNLQNKERGLVIEVRKAGLTQGVHYAEVHAFDTENINMGPVFRIPVTVVIPENINRLLPTTTEFDLGKLSYRPGQRLRKFFFVPHGATWAELVLSSDEKETDFRYIVHAVQLMADTAFIAYEFDKFLTVKANGTDNKMIFKVKGGSTMELCISRYWNLPGDSTLEGKLSFHGLKPDCGRIHMDGNQNYCRLNVTNEMSMEQISPKATLTHHVIPVAPKENVIRPLGEQDLLPDNEQIYSLEMTYNFNMAKAGEIIPMAPQFHDLLYENKYESQLWMLYDSNKYLIRSGDAFPIKYNYTCKVDKGDHVLRMQIRHSDLPSLEALKDMPIHLQVKLASNISCDVFSSRQDLLNKQKKFKEMTLNKEAFQPVYIAAPAEDKFPKGFKPGHKLIGTVSFSSTADKQSKYPFSMSAPQSKNSAEKKENKPEKSLEEQYANGMDEFFAQWFPKLLDSAMEKDIMERFTGSLTAQEAVLNALDSSKERMKNLKKITEAAQKILADIDSEKLLSYFGAKAHQTDEQIKLKEQMDKEKASYINATYKLGLAISDGLLEARQSEVPTEEAEFSIERLNECYHNLAKFVDSSDAKMQLLSARHGVAHGHYGRALKALLNHIDENGHTKEMASKVIEMVQKLGFAHIEEYLNKWQQVRFPNSYELF